MTCFCYSNPKMPEVHSCEHYILRKRGEVLMAVIEQSAWQDGVIFTSTQEADTMDSIKARGLGYTFASCSSNTASVRKMLQGHTCADDFINIMIDCTDESTVSIIKKINEEKPSSANKPFRSNYLVRTSGSLFNISALGRLLKDGDNAAVVGYQGVTLAKRTWTRSLFRKTWRSALVPSFRVERCMYDCWNTDRMMAVGTFREAEAVLSREDMIIPAVWQQFYGKMLVAAAIWYPPFYIGTELNGFTGGMEYEIMDTLRERFNYSLTTVPARGNTWGNNRGNGVWTGMVGQVVDQEADFCIGGLTVLPSRSEGIDYLTPHYQEVNAVVVNLPWTRSGFFYEVFSPLLWCAVVCLPAFAAILLWVLNVIFDVPIFGEGKERFRDVFFLSYGVAMFQGSKIGVKSLTGKLILFFFWLTVIIILATYAGNLTANLAVKKVSLPFRKLEAIKDEDEYVVAIKPGSTREALWASSAEGTLFHSLYLKVQRTAPRSLIKNSADAVVRMISDPQLVYVADKTAINNRLKIAGLCSFAFVPDEFYPSGLGIGTKKNSPQKKHFDVQIRKMMEMGLTDFWKNIYEIKDNCTNLRIPQAKGTPISVTDSQWLFILLAAGMGLSLLAGMVEMIIKCSLQIYRKVAKQKDENDATHDGDVVYAETSH